MKHFKIVTISLVLFVSFQLRAQEVLDKQKIEEVCLNYLDGFYNGDSLKIINSLKPSLYKFGYWKNRETGKYEADGHMTFRQAVDYSKRVLEKKSFAKSDAPKSVEVLDVMNHIAVAKITAWWGYDYLLLSRSKDSWIIEQVLWEGPLKRGKDQSNITQEKIETIDLFIEQETELGFSGSVLISENNNILLSKGYGFADREQKILNNENTIFEIASITKLFTVVAILQLVERNKISLDDRISKYLGEFNSLKDSATINQLLLHTAGLVPRGYELDYDSRENFIESVKNAPLESVPGKAYRYTNAGYVILAAIIEKVSKISYDDYLEKKIFKPLNLENTTYGIKSHIKNISIGYSGNTTGSLKAFSTGKLIWGDQGPSGILTNIHDLHKFLNGLDNEKLIKKEYLLKMYNEQMDGEAFGFHVLDRSGLGKVLARGGGLPHFESQIAWYKEKDIRVIILINNHLRKRQPIWDGIEKILFNIE